MGAPPAASGRSSLQLRPGDTQVHLADKPEAAVGAGLVYPQWSGTDPRTSSAQSLTPSSVGESAAERDGPKRTLLVVYIHGYMGNDSSFQSFPAHVHQYLKFALADTHVIHTKIYPRYKTYKAIEVARDNFSQWLEPHESDTTDVVLVGREFSAPPLGGYDLSGLIANPRFPDSMGGLLAAEVVLMVSS